MKSQYIILFLITLVTHAGAQTTPEKPPLPSGPILANPEYAQWQVVITQKPDKKNPDASQKSNDTSPSVNNKITINVKKTKNLRLETIEDSSAGKITKWCDGDWQLISTPGEPEPTLYTRPDPDPAHNFFVSYAKSPFPEVAWVSAQNYVGVQKLAGRDCMVFEGKIKSFSENEIKDRDIEARLSGKTLDISNPESSIVAYIALDNHLPVFFKNGNKENLYQFSPPPSSMLEFPPEIKALFELHKQQKKMSTVMPARSW